MQGVPEECRSLLERLGGVRGIATKLSTNVETGIKPNATFLTANGTRDWKAGEERAAGRVGPADRRIHDSATRIISYLR